MKRRAYATPAAFKSALDQRLRNVAEPGGIARRRQLLVFDRYLARLVRVLGDAAILKGGLVLELRLERARTTRDIDLRLAGSPDGLLARLQEAGRLDLGDFMSFEVRVDTRHPDITGPGVQYEGQRFRAECRLAGMLYGQPFGVDVAFGDPILGEPELITGDDLLAFADIAAPELRVYPVETHVAEKLHAYTLPRATPSTRVKDLPDLALLAQTGPRDARRVRAAFAQTFGFRSTHPVPARLPDPPLDWNEPYAAMAEEDALPWATLDDLVGAAREFLDPVLGSVADGSWNPASWKWELTKSRSGARIDDDNSEGPRKRPAVESKPSFDPLHMMVWSTIHPRPLRTEDLGDQFRQFFEAHVFLVGEDEWPEERPDAAEAVAHVRWQLLRYDVLVNAGENGLIGFGRAGRSQAAARRRRATARSPAASRPGSAVSAARVGRA